MKSGQDTRALNALRAAGYILDQVPMMREQDLLRIPGISRKHVERLRALATIPPIA